MRTLKRLPIFFFFLFFFSTLLQAQVVKPVKWSFSVSGLKDNQAKIMFTAAIDPGWHLYSQHVDKGGPVPTAFRFDKNKNFELIGNVSEPTPKTVYDEIFSMNVKYFDTKAIFVQKIKILTDQPFSVTGTFEYMTCNDESCIPFFDNDFSVKITPEGVSEVNGKDKSFPDKVTVADSMKKDIQQSKDTTSNLVPSSEDALNAGGSSRSLLIFFLLSFLGGLAAILTPCVFPMIPMTVTFFMNDKKSSAANKLEALVYGGSIILIYTIVGTIVALTLGPNFANWLSTHWLPNILFFLIFMVFAASFLGLFEITLPSWLINKTDKKADQGGYLGAFFMAFTLVLVSFSCTGPIVGAILVQSAGGQVLMPVIGMLGFSLAFALPFTLFAFFPHWLSKLPKSGGWLNSVKVTLGFIELALGLKFLSVADQTYHWGILDRDLYLAIWIVLFTLLGFYFLGKIRLTHDSEVKQIGVFRLTLAIITFSFVAYMIPGMFGAPLKGLAGYLPPQATHDFDLAAIIRNHNPGQDNDQSVEKSLCEKPKYSDFLHLPHGLNGYFDYEQGMACAKQLGKPVFIDFTGHGCVNCREMEAAVWSDPQVLRRLKDQFVIIALYVDDKTTLPEKDWIKSSYDGKVKKNIGQKYADFQISRFNVNAQPYYVLLDNEGGLLVKPRAYNKNIDEFVKFLDEGLAAYNLKYSI